MKLPVLITPGDPSGIGPEITLKSWVYGLKNIVVIGNIEHLTDVAKNCSIKIKFSFCMLIFILRERLGRTFLFYLVIVPPWTGRVTMAPQKKVNFS